MTIELYQPNREKANSNLARVKTLFTQYIFEIKPTKIASLEKQISEMNFETLLGYYAHLLKNFSANSQMNLQAGEYALEEALLFHTQFIQPKIDTVIEISNHYAKNLNGTQDTTYIERTLLNVNPYLKILAFYEMRDSAKLNKMAGNIDLTNKIRRDAEIFFREFIKPDSRVHDKLETFLYRISKDPE